MERFYADPVANMLALAMAQVDVEKWSPTAWMHELRRPDGRWMGSDEAEAVHAVGRSLRHQLTGRRSAAERADEDAERTVRPNPLRHTAIGLKKPPPNVPF